MPARTPAERALIARIAAGARWSKETDRAAATAAARQAATDRFAKQVDPDGVLDPAERDRRAAAAKAEFYARLQLSSLRARRAAAEKPRPRPTPTGRDGRRDAAPDGTAAANPPAACEEGPGPLGLPVQRSGPTPTSPQLRQLAVGAPGIAVGGPGCEGWPGPPTTAT